MNENKQISVYNAIIANLHKDLGDTKTLAAIDTAIKEINEQNELTQEELNKLADYIKRDVLHAASTIPDNSKQSMTEWLKFDVELIENFALDAFLNIADQTRLELATLEQDAIHNNIYHTGEITGPGTLFCESCNQAFTSTTTSEIPKCPHCQGKTFVRS